MRITDLDNNLDLALQESFDTTFDWNTGFSTKYIREFFARAPDGSAITINYFSPDAFKKTVEVNFSRNGDMSTTGKRNEYNIFGAVINHINDFVQKNDLEQVFFAAHKPLGGFGVRDTTRSDLYKKMAKKLSGKLGFEYSVEDHGSNDIFTLTKKDRQVKEEKSHNLIDNVKGWGAVPNNQDIDYLGLRVMMKPSIFLSLAAPLGSEPSEKIIKHIQDGGKIGSPFLVIDIPPEWEENDLSKVAKVRSHEGRNRMKSILKAYGDIPIETHLFFSSGVRNRHLTDKMISSMKSKMQSEKSKKTLNGPLFVTNANINEWGRIVKGVNTTPDVGTDEIKKQAAKFGNRVDRDGRPPMLNKKTRGSKTNVLFNLGLAEGVYYKNDILLENVIYEGFLDSAKIYLGNKFNQTANDIQGAVSDFKNAGILIKDIVSDQDYLVLVNTQLNKNIGTLTKQINRLSAGNQIISNIWNKIKNIVFSIKNAKNWKGFLGKLGIYGFLKFIVTNTNNIKDTVINLLLDKVTDLENLIPNATLGGFLQVFEGLQFVKKYFLDILTIIKEKLEFGRNIKKESKVLNELIMSTNTISATGNWKNEYLGDNINTVKGNPQPASDYNDYTVYFGGSSDLREVYLTDKNQVVIGKLSLMKISRNAPVYRVAVAVMHKPYRGQNIIQGVYSHLIQEHGMTLAADIIQSPGAMRSWAKLNSDPNITVYSANQDKNGKWTYSGVEGEDFLSGSFAVYRKEYEEELEKLFHEKDKIENFLVKLKKEYKQDPSSELKKDIEYYTNQVADIEDQIKKTHSEKSSREREGIDKTFLLATRAKNPEKTESVLQAHTSEIFPELEQELAEGPRDAMRKLAKSAAVATSLATAGAMGATGYSGLKSTPASAAQATQTQPIVKKPPEVTRPKARPSGLSTASSDEPKDKSEPEVSSDSEFAPEKSLRPVSRPTDIYLSDTPEEKALIIYARAKGITGDELAALMAQTATETGGFKKMVERGSKEYFNRYEPESSPERAKILGNTKQGDGYRYRGRGYVQLTGKYNYRMAGKALGLDLVENPDLAADPKNALRIAVWFWNWRVKKSTNDFSDTKKVTRLLNGGDHGLEKRKKYFDRYTKRQKTLGFVEENKAPYPYMEKYNPMQVAIIEGGHTLEDNDTDNKNSIFDVLTQDIREQLEEKSNVKIHNTSVMDHYRGESFAEKLLTVDGIVKAILKLSILGDEIYIQYVETAEDSKRKGYAKKLVDDLFTEFPDKIISVSMMTDSGSKFFRSQYHIDDETGELTQK